MWVHRRAYLIGMAGVVILVMMSGCAGMFSTNGPMSGSSNEELSGVHTEVVDGQPVIVVKYSVDEYATILAEGPEGNILNTVKVSSSNHRASIVIPNLEPGTYKIALETGGETVATKEITLRGADTELAEVDATWDRNRLQEVTVTVKNTGDLPTRIRKVRYAARDQQVESGTLYHWVGPNDSETVKVSSDYGDAISIQKPGQVRGTVTVSVSDQDLTGTFSRVFEGANLTIMSVRPDWQQSSLVRVRATVANKGDLPASVTAAVQRHGEPLAESSNEKLPPETTAEITINNIDGPIFKVDRPGSYEFTAVVHWASGSTKQQFTRTFDSPNLSIASVKPHWKDGRLSKFDYTIKNTGDLQAKAENITLHVGKTKADAWGVFVDPHSTASESITSDVWEDGIYTPSEGGNVSMTLTLDSPYGSDSMTVVSSVGELNAEITNLEGTFFDQYDSDVVALSSSKLSIRNTGDIPFAVDHVEFGVEGVTTTVSLTYPIQVSPGEQKKEFIYLDEELVVPSDENMVIVRLMDGDTVIATAEIKVTEDNTQ